MKQTLLGMLILLSFAENHAGAVDVSTGDILRIDFDLSSPPIDTSVGYSITLTTTMETLVERGRFDFFEGDLLTTTLEFSVGGQSSLEAEHPKYLPIYVIVTDIVGEYDVTAFLVSQRGDVYQGVYVLNPPAAPIPTSFSLSPQAPAHSASSDGVANAKQRQWP